MRKTTSGFTIVELLIVIIVIAILAAITIVAYNGMQNRTYDTAIKADLAASIKSVELYKIDNGTYPGSYSNLTAMKTAGYSLKATQTSYDTSTNNYLFCYDTSNDGYAIAGHSRSGKVWYVTNKQRVPTEYATWYASVASMCPLLVDTYGNGQWSYQSGAWSASLVN